MERKIIKKNTTINVPLLNSDTLDTFSQRVASTFNTVPELMTEINLVDDPQVISLVVDDIKELRGKTFREFIREADVLNRYKKLSSIPFLLKLWASYSRDSFNDSFFVMITENEISEDYPLEKFDIKNFLSRDERDFRDKLEKKVKENSERSKKYTVIHKKLSELGTTEHLEFKKEKSEFRISTNIHRDNYSIDTVFNAIRCNKFVPFALFKENFKLFDDGRIPPPGWNESLPGSIIFVKILQDDHPTIGQYLTGELPSNEYTDGTMSFSDEGYLVLDIIVDYSVMSMEKLKGRFLSIITFPNLLIQQEIEESITGMVLFPEQSFDTYVMSDFIMNNDIPVIFMAVEESLKTTKKKSGLFLRIFSPGTNSEDGTCSIISKKVVKGDTDLKGIGRKRFPPGSDFIRLRINKVKNIDIVNRFVEIFSKLLTLYKEKKLEIMDFYRKYLPEFSKKVEEDVRDEKSEINLREIAPDLFYPGYSRKCPNPPDIIDDDDVDESKFQVMKYPKTPEEGTQYNYTCGSKPDGYTYIGLRNNNLKNRDVYPYIPCCFKTDQRTRGTNPYREYYEGNIVKKGSQQNILKTNRFAPLDEFADLPKTIGDIFFSIDPEYGYSRKGVHPGKQTFLECVLEGAYSVKDNGIVKHFAGYTSSKKLSVLSEQYQELINYPELAVASQENPGDSPLDMRNHLKDASQYMDPRRWVRLCEVVYNCKILLFSRSKESKSDVFLETPYYKDVYLRYSSKPQKTLFIYEHWGGESDLSEFPRCELIVKWDKSKGDSEYNFFGKIPNEINKMQKKYFKQSWYSQFKNKLVQIKEIELPPQFSSTLVSQIIDSRGKARAFMTNEGILLFTDPLPPLNLPLYQGLETRSSVEDIEKFTKKYDLKIVSQYFLNELLEVNIMFPGDIILTVKTFGNNVLHGIQLESNEKYPNMLPYIENFQYLKRISFLLVEYFVYMFSIFSFENEEDLSLKTIKKFVNTKIKLVNDVKYIIPNSPGFSFLNEDNFVNGGKLIVDTLETLKKLVYSLRLRLSLNEREVRDYHTKNEVRDFYKDVWGDVDKNIIVKNFSAFQNIDNYIYPGLQTSLQKYFVSLTPHKEIELVIGKDNLEKSQNISKNWLQFHRVMSTENREKVNTRLCVFKNIRKISEVKKITQKGAKDNVNIAVFKKDGIVHYSSMLKLNYFSNIK